ncbi:GNAT family N-acetyltransferase [Halalkalibacillus sediminis]|nr:GNAT family N-acetyltransferase [Halalkalibacillus sediminis]
MQKTNNYTIRLATKEEVPQVISLLKDVAASLNKNGIEQWGFLLQGGDDAEIEQAIKNQDTYVLLDEDRMIGTFTIYNQPEEWDLHIWRDKAHDSSYLHRLAVAPSYQGNDLGGIMLDWIDDNHMGFSNTLRLDCVANNDRLKDYYLQQGYQLIGTYDDHYMLEKKMN